MIQFDKPKNLNGAELLQELITAGINISEDKSSMLDDGEGNLLLDISDADKSAAAAIVKNHNGTMIAPEQSLDDKLAIVGLTIADLKTALGL
jgi:hypothetical protein